jgi:hypothetical protein
MKNLNIKTIKPNMPKAADPKIEVAKARKKGKTPSTEKIVKNII